MCDLISISIKGEDKVNVPKGTRYYELVNERNNPLIIAVRVNNELVSLNTKINNNDHVEFVLNTTATGSKIYKCGLRFVLLVALKESFGNNYDVSFDHSVSRGIHVTIKSSENFLEKDVNVLKEAMKKIVLEDSVIQRINIDKHEAIRFYNNIGEKEKSRNIHNVSNNVVTLYKLHNYINYFYVEMPYSTKNLDIFDLIYLGPNELVLLVPQRKQNNELATYVHYTKVIDNYKTSTNWLKEQRMNYLPSVNEIVTNLKIKDLIKSSEMYFDINIEKAVEEILNRKSKFVLIAGPSSSGKTTTTKKIALTLKALGYKPFMISVDDFFKDRDEMVPDEFGNYDFEALDAVDTVLLGKTLKELIKGKTVTMPRFDFVHGKKVFDSNVKLPDNSIILMEGLHCLNDAMIPDIEDSLKYKIYLSPFIALNVDRHNYISSTDLRIIRRIVRDKRTRNRSVDQTIAYLETLRLGEERYIYPFVNEADIIINTSLVYEVGVLKVYAEPLLYSIDGNSPYYEEARRLINFLKGFFPIPSEYVNDDSILREFIGGSIFD